MSRTFFKIRGTRPKYGNNPNLDNIYAVPHRSGTEMRHGTAYGHMRSFTLPFLPVGIRCHGNVRVFGNFGIIICLTR